MSSSEGSRHSLSSGGSGRKTQKLHRRSEEHRNRENLAHWVLVREVFGSQRSYWFNATTMETSWYPPVPLDVRENHARERTESLEAVNRVSPSVLSYDSDDSGGQLLASSEVHSGLLLSPPAAEEDHHSRRGSMSSLDSRSAGRPRRAASMVPAPSRWRPRRTSSGDLTRRILARKGLLTDVRDHLSKTDAGDDRDDDEVTSHDGGLNAVRSGFVSIVVEGRGIGIGDESDFKVAYLLAGSSPVGTLVRCVRGDLVAFLGGDANASCPITVTMDGSQISEDVLIIDLQRMRRTFRTVNQQEPSLAIAPLELFFACQRTYNGQAWVLAASSSGKESALNYVGDGHLELAMRSPTGQYAQHQVRRGAMVREAVQPRWESPSGPVSTFTSCSFVVYAVVVTPMLTRLLRPAGPAVSILVSLLQLLTLICAPLLYLLAFDLRGVSNRHLFNTAKGASPGNLVIFLWLVVTWATSLLLSSGDLLALSLVTLMFLMLAPIAWLQGRADRLQSQRVG